MIMPGMGGEETLRSLKRIKADARIILTTGVVLSGAREKLIGIGAKDFLHKPFLLEDLKKVLEGVLKT